MAVVKFCVTGIACPTFATVHGKTPAPIGGSGLLVLFDFLLIFCAGFMIGDF